MIKPKGCAEIEIMKYKILHLFELIKAILRSGATRMKRHKDFIVLGKDFM